MTDFLMTRLDIYEFIHLEIFPYASSSISLQTNLVKEQIQKQLNP